MLLGKVVSTVVSTSKHPRLSGLKLLVVRPYRQDGDGLVVAADVVGAGVGQLVLLTMGEPAHKALQEQAPVDAVVVGIVDNEPSF